jgi:hypothetical protein
MIVYTAIFNGYEQLRPLPETPNGTRFICYTDNVQAGMSGWETRRVVCRMDQERCALYCKILSTVCFPGEVTVWIGDGVALRGNIGALAELVSDADIAVLQSPDRDCLYVEAEDCIRRQADSPQVIRNQTDRYLRERYPKHRGLSNTSLIVRRETPRLRQFEELWWQEVDRGSYHDRISFDYACWKMGVHPVVIPGDNYGGPFHKRAGIRIL